MVESQKISGLIRLGGWAAPGRQSVGEGWTSGRSWTQQIPTRAQQKVVRSHSTPAATPVLDIPPFFCSYSLVFLVLYVFSLILALNC